MLKRMVLISSVLAVVQIGYAISPSVVSSNSCTMLKGSNQPFILSLKQGENLNQAIVHCANDASLPGAIVSGLGAVKNPTLHYYDEKTQQNVQKQWQGLYELVSLNGDVYFANGKRQVHLHAGLSDQQYQMFGGNLDNATVGVLAEVAIFPLPASVIRQHDPATGFDLLYAGS